jgi:UDP-N-acetylmuramyl pentapeptide synthase
MLTSGNPRVDEVAMDCRWKAWTTATTPEKALRVGRRLLETLRVKDPALQIEPYPKTNGHVVSFTVNVGEESWANAVVAVISAAQTVGAGWQVHGRIAEELEIISNKPSVGGLTMLSCTITRDGVR